MNRLALMKPRQSRCGHTAMSKASSTSGSAKARLNLAMSAKANVRARRIDRRVVRPKRMIVTPIHNSIDPNRPAITSLLIAPLMKRNCGLKATIAAAAASQRFAIGKNSEREAIRDPHHDRADDDVDPARHMHHQHDAGIRPLLVGAVQITILVIVVDLPVAITVIGIVHRLVQRWLIGWNPDWSRAPRSDSTTADDAPGCAADRRVVRAAHEIPECNGCSESDAVRRWIRRWD